MMAETSASCTFEGQVAEVRVVGAGRAMLLDPSLFADGHTARVELVGALGNAALTGGFSGLDPVQLNPPCEPFDATYRAGRGIVVAVAKGGEAGGFVGVLPGGRDCSARCDVVWAGEKKLVVERAGAEAGKLAGPIPMGDAKACEGKVVQAGAEKVVVLAVKGGFLRCGGQELKVEGDWVFGAGAARSLVVEKVEARGAEIWVRVQNEMAPLPMAAVGLRFPTRELGKVPVPEEPPWGILGGGAGVLVAAAVVGLVALRGRTAKASSAPRKELHEALLKAFPSREKLAQMVRHGLDKNLADMAGEGALRDTVFQLLEDAEANGYTMKLVRAAREENPGNVQLAEAARKMGVD